jgi:carbonic anhydrase
MTDLRFALAAPLWVAAMSLPAAVVAAEHAAGRAPVGAPAGHAATSSAAPAQAAKAAPAPAAPTDPMEQLRLRLAERLAASQGAGAGHARELRVAARPAAAASAALAAQAPPALRSAQHAPAAARASTVKSVAAHSSVPVPPKAALASPRPVAAAHKPGGARHATRAPAPWGYQGPAGPQAWGGLQPQFSMCSTGQRQSPIDIREGLAVDLEAVQFNYQASGFAVVDNGHTVQVNVAPGNSIEVGGRRFELQQFHFHRPSEERIDGRAFEMSVHLVHKDEQGRLVVVTLLIDKGPAQPVVQKVWNNLPLERMEEVAARVPLELASLLPADRRYYTYMGSLTTPPCTEGVQWIVMRQPVTLSPEQIELFARIYPMNARPVQSASGRRIMQSN